MKNLIFRLIFCNALFFSFQFLHGSTEEHTPKTDNQKSVIQLGCTLDLSRGAKGYGSLYKKCMNYMIEKVNREGGIQGKSIQLNILNDEYNPQKAQENIQKLLNKNINIIACPVGTPTLESYIDLIKEKKLVVLFPEASSSIFRKPNLTNIIHLVESHFILGYELIKNMLKNQIVEKVAFFYQNDHFGKDMLRGARKALDEFNVSQDNYLEVSYERNNLEFTDQIKRIQAEHVDSIVFFATSRSAMSFIKQMGLENIRAKKLFAAPDLQIAEFEKFAKEKSIDLTIINELPNPTESNIAIAKKFRDEVAQSNGNLSLNVYCFKAYISLSLLIDVLKKIDSPITKNKIISSFEAMKNYDFGGLKLNFDKKTRQLLHSVWLNSGKKQWKQIPTTPQNIRTKQEAAKPETVAHKKNNIIRFGSTFDLSKGLRTRGMKYNESTNYLIGKQNQKGGINDKKIKFISRDDGYNPANALNNVRDLFSQYNIDILLFPTGTATLKTFLPFARENKILVLFPGSRASIFRKPELKNIIHLWASCYQEGYVLIKHLLETQEAQKIAFFYQNDNFGRDLLRGAKKAIKDLGFNDNSYIEVAHGRNDLTFKSGIERIKNTHVNVICFFSTSIATQSFIRQFGLENIQTKKLYGCSELAASDFQSFIKSRTLKFVISSAVPNPTEMESAGNSTNKLAIIDMFQNAVKESNGKLSLDVISCKTYLGLSLLFKLLEKMTGPITKEKIISSLEQLNDYNFGGLTLNFDKKTRQLLHSIWIDTGKSKWKRVDLRKEFDMPEKEIEPTGFF